jgi:Spy/CpxP family protein refolding chaperone
MRTNFQINARRFLTSAVDVFAFAAAAPCALAAGGGGGQQQRRQELQGKLDLARQQLQAINKICGSTECEEYEDLSDAIAHPGGA